MSTHPAGLAGAATAAPLSLRLREGTRERHDSVEHAAAINRLIVVKVPRPESATSPQEREARVRALAEYREAYRLFLLSAHGFEAAVVAQLAGSQVFEAAKASGYADEGTPSTVLIRKDLERVFGPTSAAGLPVMEGLPAVGSLAEFAGMEYVRRGSRAGGAVIGAVVAHNLGFDRESGASFLQQHGKDTRRVLVAFKEWVDSLPLSEADCLAAVKSANETFLAVERWHRQLERDFLRA
jgi:heme oxygenase